MDRLDRCRLLSAVVRAGSIARAGDLIGISPQAIGRQLDKLERDAGGELLRRTNRGAEPTALATALLVGVEPLIARFDSIWEEVTTARAQPVASVAHSLSLAWETAPALADAVSRDLAARVNTVPTPTPEILRQVLDGTIDVGLTRCHQQQPTALPGGHHHELVATVVRREPQGVVFRVGHRLADRPELTLADLAGERWWIRPRHTNPGLQDTTAAWFAAAGYEPTVVAGPDALDLAESPIRSGTVALRGVSVVPSLPAELVWRPLRGGASLDLVAYRLLDPAPATAPPGQIDRPLGWAGAIVAAMVAEAERRNWLG